MRAPEVPHNEQERLEAVRSLNILDTAPEDNFERITRMAATIMDVPIACVTIVDSERQWFKSHYGLGVTETPRDISFCGHTINSNALFVVHDARKDERFSDNPLVTGEPNISFYIGVPLKGPEGLPVGALCAIGETPVEPSPQQKKLLEDLGQLVESELQLRRESATDALSGLLNRRQFDRLAEIEISRAKRYKHPVAVGMIDVDHFKEVNDQLGHDVGDQVISAIGKSLPSLVKRNGDISSRIGGDEFAVMLVDTDKKGAEKLGKSLCDALNQSIASVLGEALKEKIDAGISVGMAVFQGEQYGVSLKDVMSVADQALYESKRNGGDKVSVRTPH